MLHQPAVCMISYTSKYRRSTSFGGGTMFQAHIKQQWASRYSCTTWSFFALDMQTVFLTVVPHNFSSFFLTCCHSSSFIQSELGIFLSNSRDNSTSVARRDTLSAPLDLAPSCGRPATCALVPDGAVSVVLGLLAVTRSPCWPLGGSSRGPLAAAAAAAVHASPSTCSR